MFFPISNIFSFPEYYFTEGPYYILQYISNSTKNQSKSQVLSACERSLLILLIFFLIGLQISVIFELTGRDQTFYSLAFLFIIQICYRGYWNGFYHSAQML